MADWDGAGYSAVSGLQPQMAAEALSLLTPSGSEDVLDIGCGDGASPLTCCWTSSPTMRSTPTNWSG
ncbi:class I SAM-dependent methyltransferase [Mycolicibacterium confluentis]|uniref:Uncharacterized protein n=1 Tax=Mycolicibacterium confluentis TaxID=28047 RepID=A0A7I7XSP7_9MYCO|nr:hypothetical protein [Mycolicibacterium confluentis]MCV7321334.1 hypothetical protein [Mycolicibacterium confluentis]ORV25201.1 hypothetical protein AWB99_22165 [Mycolicibacterium confluentis]BBZ32184.1 hypothetical protein MCNF_07890 [Mycolicibacterium confluentis]